MYKYLKPGSVTLFECIDEGINFLYLEAIEVSIGHAVAFNVRIQNHSDSHAITVAIDL